MPVFISHDFDDKPDFDNIAEALEREGIEYWKPTSLKGGASLAEQLRAAIAEAEACVFVATRNSVASSWCGAELGAFWGARKPVVIWVAESTLPMEELPKQFQHDLAVRRIRRVVESVRDHLAAGGPREDEHVESVDLVAAMTRGELRTMMNEAVERVQDAAFAEKRLSEIADLYEASAADDEDANRQLAQLLTGLLGLPESRIEEGAEGRWNNFTAFATTSGEWRGKSFGGWEEHEDARAPISYYRRNLVWRADDGYLEAIALIDSITDHDAHDVVSVDPPRVIVGRGGLGSLVRDISR